MGHINNLAVCYMAQGREAEARALLERALPVLAAALDPAHRHLALCRENYADGPGYEDLPAAQHSAVIEN